MNCCVYVVVISRVVPIDFEQYFMVTSFVIPLSIFPSVILISRARSEPKETDFLTDFVPVNIDHLESLTVSSVESAFKFSLVADVIS